MQARTTVMAAVVALTLGQWPTTAAAQTVRPMTAAVASPAASTPLTAKSAITARSPADWIEYDDATYTPVLDDVSQALADARSALARNDRVEAASAMHAAARALAVEADRAGRVDRQRAAADMTLARETHARLRALTNRLDATAAQIRAGKLVTTVALDKILDKAARADLERRWLVTDVTGWYPVAEEPQRHLGAAAAAYAKKDYRAAATEARKAAAYVRLESARAVGAARRGLEAANADLETTARAFDKGVLHVDKDMDRTFAAADRALALAHRAKAAEAWSRKAYDASGYELQASAQGLGDAAAWVGTDAKVAASAGVSAAHAVGDKLARGGVWVKDEVARGFESLGGALNRLGQSIGSKAKAAPFDVGA
jgi:hypothetical protein